LITAPNIVLISLPDAALTTSAACSASKSGDTSYTSTDDSTSDDGFELPPFLQNRNF